jgi:hypothetical protein
MSATSSSSDKYLFLFKTGTDDLSGIKTALQTYYKFPAGAANTFETTGCSSFKSTFKTLVETLGGTDPLAPVYKMPDPSGKVPLGETNMNTLVVVISGEADSTGLADDPLNPASPHVLWADIRNTIFGMFGPKIYPYQLYTEIHVIFVSPFCNSFMAEWTMNIPVTSGTLTIPVTISDAIDQAGREGFVGTLSTELMLGTSTILDNFGRISFNDIASSVLSSSVTGCFRSEGTGVGGKYFPGYTTFEINDGSPEWWESPDIYINSPGNDLYNSGVSNTVYINVHTSGTHPVKNFWIGAKHFGTGLGASDGVEVANLIAGSVNLPLVLKGGESCLFSYDYTFSSLTTHRCIVVRAKFTTIIQTDIDDYAEWSIVANADEAQRNIDPAGLGKSSAAPPAPEEAQNPETDPVPAQEDQNNTGDRTLKNIRGIKEHIYWIHNPFKEKKTFRIVAPKAFEQILKTIKIEFFRITENNIAKRIPLKFIATPYLHIPITLESMEKAQILFIISWKEKVKSGSEIRVPFEVLVEAKGFKNFTPRKSSFLKIDKNFIPAGGITVKVSNKAFTIRGKVLNSAGEPVPGARVFIRTVNGLQAAVLKTTKEGTFRMPEINPDSYRMYASTKDWYTDFRIVNLFTRDVDIDFRQSKKRK